MVEDKWLAVSRACEAARLSRAAYYRPVQDPAVHDREIVAALNEIVATELRWGFWKCFDRLRQLGKPWNHKRVHRVYCQMRLKSEASNQEATTKS